MKSRSKSGIRCKKGSHRRIKSIGGDARKGARCIKNVRKSVRKSKARKSHRKSKARKSVRKSKTRKSHRRSKARK